MSQQSASLVTKDEFYASSFIHLKERSPITVRYKDAVEMGEELDGLLKLNPFWDLAWVDWSRNTITLRAKPKE